MTRTEIDSLRKVFTSYCSTFHDCSPEDHRNFLLKEIHTEEVCRNMNAISSEVFPEEVGHRNLAEAVALFHDIGRFPQYRDYGTFRDSDSVNHAALGASILGREMLDGVDAEERRIIIEAVRLHNVFTLPKRIDEQVLPFLRLIRDADKLDIWRVFIEYFDLPPEERASAAGLGFADRPECSEEVLRQVISGKMVDLATVSTLNDFKLLQLSWVFDLNFGRSIELVSERDYVGRLSATLPDDPIVCSAVAAIKGYIQDRLL